MIAIALVFAVLGLVIIAGWGDKLIAGYNTASDAERATVNVKRLRLLVAGVCWLCALLLPLSSLGSWASIGATTGIFIGSIACVALANTWAKRKP